MHITISDITKRGSEYDRLERFLHTHWDQSVRGDGRAINHTVAQNLLRPRYRGTLLFDAFQGKNHLGILQTHPKNIHGEPGYSLDCLVVNKRHRGRGVGSALLSEFVTTMDGYEMPSALQVHEAKSSLIRMYQKSGFDASDAMTCRPAPGYIHMIRPALGRS